ncbi:YidB family protein [Enterovirga rhinocerotis]|uniref:Uncharacterized protein DUF937 n=1 Tax=Enterovirga rhinocerotis TaxID=1339210 RepID=A0A4R7BXX9_9HYPH|nr:YidB family protein [Enterovirga rhinocerotis]TDR89057.1 uncharacterized protein DUF937 [Enterovirga rhinocerotis]
MSRGYPSLAALLGLVAVAGYQNREKIGEWLGSLSGPSGQAGDRPGGLDGVLGPWRDASGQTEAGAARSGDGGLLGGGLKDLVDQFRNAGHGETVDSWVNSGPNKPAESSQLETAIGPDLLKTLSQQTGLSSQEILERLSKALPEAVDRYTPDGRLPA